MKSTLFEIYSKKAADLLAVFTISSDGRSLALPQDAPKGVRKWFDTIRKDGIVSRAGCSLSGEPHFVRQKAGNPRFWEIVALDARHPDYYIKSRLKSKATAGVSLKQTKTNSRK